MTKSLFSKSFIAALGLAALALTAWQGNAFAETASQRAQEKYKDDPSIMLGNVEALDYRRTLFAPFGQKTLRLEAPQGMCFLDETNYTERQLMNRVREVMSEKHQQQIIAIFIDCLQMNGATRSSQSNALDSGYFGWPVKPGEKVPPTLKEYLETNDIMKPQEVEESMSNIIDLQIDPTPREGAAGVTVGYTGTYETNDQKVDTVGAAGVTLLQGLPVIIGVSHTGKKLQKDKEQLYALVDKMLLQQDALNNIR